MAESVSEESNSRVAAMERLLAERAELKRQKQAEKKAFWDEYHEQLAKSTPNQGGAKHRRDKIVRLLKFYKS